MIRIRIQVIAILIGLLSAFFLARSTFYLSPQDIAELSTSKWGSNPNITISLNHQCSDTKVGFFLLFISFILQATNFVGLPLRKSLIASRKGIAVAIISLIIVGFLAHLVSNRLFNNTVKQIDKLLIKKT